MLNTENKISAEDDAGNPLDGVEEIMMNNDWEYDRISAHEMSVILSGQHGDYKMIFVWQENYSALQFCCAPDIDIAPNKMEQATQIMNKINASLWLGHFDIRQQSVSANISMPKTNAPCFRYTSLFNGVNDMTAMAQMEDVIDIAIHECERHFTAFNLLTNVNFSSTKDMSLALMDVAGLA